MLYEVTRSNGLHLIFKVADKKEKKIGSENGESIWRIRQ